MIVVVAPYAPPGRGATNLGATRKLEAVIKILARTDERVVLVNSIHDALPCRQIGAQTLFVGGVEVLEITPPTYSSRPLGKLFNLFDVQELVRFIERLGTPSLVWLYNAYAFECLFASISRRFDAGIVLELEDWPLARSRGLNPKPIIDWLAWLYIRALPDHVFAVNASVAKRLKIESHRTSLLPGFVSDAVVRLRCTAPPFTQPHLTVGYFGGLTVEKGADLVADLVMKLTTRANFIVTGAGTLENRFRVLANSAPNLQFSGVVDDDQLFRLMGRCDVILNPHRPIRDFGTGIFPFKVMEAIASGRMVISTQLPMEGLEDCLDSVIFVDPSVEAFAAAICDSPSGFQRSRHALEKAAEAVIDLCGTETVTDRIMGLINNLRKKRNVGTG